MLPHVAQLSTSTGPSEITSASIAAGKLHFEIDDDATEEHYVACGSETAVNDGNPHWISFRRVGQELRMYIDCVLEVTCDAPANIRVPLVPLNVGHGVCDLPIGDPGVGSHVLDGTVENICVGRP